jgi:predicted phosphoribosyltransferase
MTDLPSRPAQPDSRTASLTDRVMARVHQAGAAADRRAKASRPRSSSRQRPAAADPLAADVTQSADQVRQVRSLRRVFYDLGDSYREYRRRTGEPVSPTVRQAANRFKQELSVTSLVSVAACLDELEILTW